MISKRSVLKDYIRILVGVILTCIAAKNIYDPANLVIGGVSGIAIMVRHFTGMPLWLTNTLINAPLFIVAYKLKGWLFIKRTFFATCFMSLVLFLLPDYNLIPNNDMFLAAIFGGILTGLGSGFVFNALATTGGSDTLAALIQLKFRHLSIPKILVFVDWSIVLTSIAVFKPINVLYATVSVYVLNKISNNIIDGLNFAKSVFIVSDDSELIAKVIMEKLVRGVTAFKSKGMYSGLDRMTLYCVVAPREIAIVKDIVHDIDPGAFMIVSDVNEVSGEGFSFERSEESLEELRKKYDL